MGTGLHLDGGGKVQLAGSETECWTNIEYCTVGVTMSIWVKPTASGEPFYIAATGSISQRGFGFYSENHGGVDALVTLDNGRYHALSKSKLVAGNWHLVTCMYKAGDGISIYINGILEEGADEADTWTEQSVTEVDWNAHIGVKDLQPYNTIPLNGYVDEFKYFYRILNSAGREGKLSLQNNSDNFAYHLKQYKKKKERPLSSHCTLHIPPKLICHTKINSVFTFDTVLYQILP